MTLSREEDWQISRSAKYPKIEGLQLHSLLLDEPPTMDVSNFGLHTLRVMFDTFNIAVAMCEGAHLASLKSYSSKFISHLTTRHDSESGLRPPSMVEAQHADQKIQQIIAELVVEKAWSLDQALHEVTHIRADLAVLLQPRPKIVKPQPWGADRPNPQKGKTYEKGYGKAKTRARTKMERKEKERTRGSPKCKSMGFGNHSASNTNWGNATIQIANIYINVLFLVLTERHAAPSIQRRNTFRFPTDNYPTKTMVSQSQIQTR